MKLKYFLITFLFLSSGLLIGQNSLNEYKYVIVPSKYDFLKQEDQYQLNSLTTFLFQKDGFQVLLDKDTRPKDLYDNPCLALSSRVKDNSSMFSTKLIIELVNCKNEIVFTAKEGKSKIKDFKKAYHEALRDSYKSISSLNYNYKAVKEPLVKEDDSEIKVEPMEIKKIVEVEKVDESAKLKEVEEIDNDKKMVAIDKIDNVAEVDELPEKDSDSSKLEINELKKDNKIVEVKPSSNLLYAQANSQGFQLVDSTPKVVYILLKTSMDDIFVLKNKNGILFKKDNHWIAEYYEESDLVKRVLEIKF